MHMIYIGKNLTFICKIYVKKLLADHYTTKRDLSAVIDEFVKVNTTMSSSKRK